MVKLFFAILTVLVFIQAHVPGHPELMYPGSADREHNALAYATYQTVSSDIRQ